MDKTGVWNRLLHSINAREKQEVVRDVDKASVAFTVVRLEGSQEHVLGRSVRHPWIDFRR